LISRITEYRLHSVEEAAAAKASTGKKPAAVTKKTGVSCLALLRGINVGGKAIIKMADLKAAFVELGFYDVSSYIQSGNVLFKTKGNKNDAAKLLETELTRKFATDIKVVIITAKEMIDIINNKPKGFGEDPARHFDVMFIRKPLTSGTLFKTLQLRDGVDRAEKGKGVIYYSKLLARAGQSYLPRIIQSPHYQNITIRNWNTVQKLGELLTM
jgi:uncharacterized protein (DUF1697 family)